MFEPSFLAPSPAPFFYPGPEYNLPCNTPHGPCPIANVDCNASQTQLNCLQVTERLFLQHMNRKPDKGNELLQPSLSPLYQANLQGCGRNYWKELLVVQQWNRLLRRGRVLLLWRSSSRGSMGTYWRSSRRISYYRQSIGLDDFVAPS